jgi:hypothetical protein
MQAQLEDYTTFKEDAWDNFNRYVKEITGAQMSENEVSRLRLAIPDPARDGPVAFKAKMTRAIQVLDRAGNVYRSMLDKGMPLKKAEEAAKNEILSGIRRKPEAKAPKAPEPSGNEVRRRDPKTGKTAVFDSDTKKFLRWEE